MKLPEGWEWADASAFAGDAGTRAYQAVFTPTDTINYNTVTLILTVEVGKAAGAAVSSPSIESKSSSSITIKALTAATGQTVEYAVSKTGGTPAAGWQTDLVFSNLDAGAVYYVFARAAGNDNYLTGIAAFTKTETGAPEESGGKKMPVWAIILISAQGAAVLGLTGLTVFLARRNKKLWLPRR